MLIGNEEDFSAALGFEIEGVDENLVGPRPGAFERLIDQVMDGYPNLAVVATTLREVASATVNDWGAVCQHDGRIPRRRRGSSDSRSSTASAAATRSPPGSSTGCWRTPVDDALAYGVAHGALAMTTPGDTSMATLAEVERVIRGAAARVVR